MVAGKEVDGTGEHGWLQRVMYVLIVVLAIYICYKGGTLLLKQDSVRQGIESSDLPQSVEDAAARTYMPGYTAAVEGKNQSGWLAGFLEPLIPVYSYLVEQGTDDGNLQADEDAGSVEAEVEAGETQSVNMSAEGNVETGENTEESQTGNMVMAENAVNTAAEATANETQGMSAVENSGNMETNVDEPSDGYSDMSDNAAGTEEPQPMMASEENSGNMETQINDDTLQAENVAGLEQDENVTSEADVGEPQSISMDHASENDMDTMSADTELQPETEDSLADDTLEASSIGSSYLSDMLLTEQIRDFDYLLSNYYTVDADTTIDGTLLDADNLLTEDLTIQQNSDEPQILIYHTHSQEAFADSVEGDVSTTIVGMGEVLAELLRTKYGYQVIHDTGVYDLVDGVLDRSKAYDYARESVQEILEEHPTIEVVIDLHRDGVDGQKFVTEIDGKMTSMVMFFNGLSQDENGEPLTWLDNPYVADNLAFSLQLQLLARAQYPGYTRNIYLKAQRYNLHLLPRSLLVEAGTQLNTVEEEQNAMEPLADLLAQVLGNRS